MKHSMKGVTLIELMVVILILGILAAIAVPSYRSYMLRSNRTEAMGELLRIRTAEEKYFLQYNRYTEDFGPPPGGLNMTLAASATRNSDNNFYQLSVDISDPPASPSFVVTATAIGQQVKDTACPTFTLDDQGTRGPSSVVATCWK